MTQTQTFRHPEYYPVLDHREWMRKYLPSSHEGYTIDDIDLVLRRYTTQNKYGQFRIVEVKKDCAYLSYSQQLLYSMLDTLLRKGDEHKHYEGFYLLQWHQDHVVLNTDVELTMDEFRQWCVGELHVDAYNLPRVVI